MSESETQWRMKKIFGDCHYIITDEAATLMIPFWSAEFGDADYESVVKRIDTAWNNHEKLVKMLDIALDAIGDVMDAGVTMGGISPETFQEARTLLADIDKERGA